MLTIALCLLGAFLAQVLWDCRLHHAGWRAGILDTVTIRRRVNWPMTIIAGILFTLVYLAYWRP